MSETPPSTPPELPSTPPETPAPSPPAPSPPARRRPARGRPAIIEPRAPGAYLPFPLWLRFGIAGLVTLVLLVALVLFVDRHNTDSPPLLDPGTERQANREAEILVSQDQVPHVTSLRAAAAPAEAMRLAIRAYVNRQINAGSLSGPLSHVGCVATGRVVGDQPFRCSVSAGGVNYEFLGVVDPTARRVTFCKHDPPPVPSDDVPVSRRCLA